MRAAFLQAQCAPRRLLQTWIYGAETHSCWIVAEESNYQMVYCEAGFGPAFPWSTQPKGTSKPGMDGEWCAYLYEAFITSSLWNREIPGGFELMGPGERG